MRIRFPVLLAAAAASAPAQVGEPLPDVELSGFTGTAASSLQDFRGRLLLLEFFAYW